MLNPKNIEESTGAENLANMMVAMAEQRNVHEVPLEELHDAPVEWNFFRPLPEGKFFELIQSIEQNGLLVPLIVWERVDPLDKRSDGYIILSGHNRKRALEKLLEQTKDPAYAKASCIVYKADSLNEGEARAILVDCNWVQRTLTTSEKARAVYTKYVQLGRIPRGENKRRYDLVAEHFGLKATQVYYYTKLTQLNDQWLDNLDAGEITIKTAVHLSKLTREQQEFLYDWPNITQKQILSIDATYSEEDMRRALTQAETRMRELRVMVPEDRYSELEEIVNAWLMEHPIAGYWAGGAARDEE